MMDKLIRTVNGSVAPTQVRFVLPHEHVLHRIGGRMNGSDLDVEERIAYRQQPMHNDGRNLIMDREDPAYRELQALQDIESSPLIIDVTLPQEGRNELHGSLQSLSKRLDVPIVSVTTVDKAKLHETGKANDQTISELAAQLENELNFGFRSSSKEDGGAGAIYQQIHILNVDLSPTDRTLIQIIASAQSRTNAPVFLSFSNGDNGLMTPSLFEIAIKTWIQELITVGASAGQLVICHADRWSDRVDFLKDLCSSGVRLAFNFIGHYAVSDMTFINPLLVPTALASRSSFLPNEIPPPSDASIAKCIAKLIQHDCADKLLLSTNITQRVQYRRFGGGGYAYLSTWFKRRLEAQLQVSDFPILWDQIVRRNPVDLLAWYTPPALAEVPKHWIKCSVCNKDFEPIEGEYFSKFEFVYCGTKCLRKHRNAKFDPAATYDGTN